MKTKTEGFTLLEIMIALTIIAVAVTAILGAQSQNLSLANESRFSTTAALLAQKKLVETIAENRLDLYADSGDFGNDFPDYRWETTLEDITLDEETLSESLKKVNVTVNWGENKLFRYTLSVLLFVKGGT